MIFQIRSLCRRTNRHSYSAHVTKMGARMAYSTPLDRYSSVLRYIISGSICSSGRKFRSTYALVDSDLRQFLQLCKKGVCIWIYDKLEWISNLSTFYVVTVPDARGFSFEASSTNSIPNRCLNFCWVCQKLHWMRVNWLGELCHLQNVESPRSFSQWLIRYA